MKRSHFAFSVLLMMMFLIASASAHGTGTSVPAQKSDAEIQKCILDGMAASASLKEQKLEATVSDGKVTITGAARNPGSKGAATRMAKRCGAKEVKNEATVENPIRPKKKAKAADAAPKN